MTVNEITQINKILKYLAKEDYENFCHAWYYGLDPFKENPNALLLIANAILTHFEVPLYTTDVGWDQTTNCFIWKFGKNTSPDYKGKS